MQLMEILLKTILVAVLIRLALWLIFERRLHQQLTALKELEAEWKARADELQAQAKCADAFLLLTEEEKAERLQEPFGRSK
jgi:hypothetical protein